MSSATNQKFEKMTEDDKFFFEQLGKVIAEQRKLLHMTQKELANEIGISQQHTASFENGTRKVPASLLPKLAKLFKMSTDQLLGLKIEPIKRGPTSILTKQMDKIALLPRAKQKFITEMLEGLIKN